MGWQTVEHWQANGEIAVWELWLKRVVDEPYSTAWRVEWGQRGHGRKGESFTGEGREQRARDELERRKDAFTYGMWRKVGH